ncbi:MAG TPA: hypothetical protein VM716_01575 [Gemmatimonadales bacterium]|nr:hypothetical protein [Gemmatimonadales bacterium]
MPAPTPERATLSRDLADFLIELSIALHKHAMYPEGHPSLGPAAAALARRAALLLEDRSTLSLGVARQQLVIEGVATDPKHPVLGELASRLHRHHLGAVTFRRGVEDAEVASVLKTLAVDADRSGSPLGLGPPERLRAWPHVQLHPLTYERLELVDDATAAMEGGAGARAAQLWVGLARAALSAQTGPDTATEPAVIARAIDEHPRSDAAAYDQVIVGYLLQIAAELKTAGSAEAIALRRRTSRLIRALKPETLRRLVEMGGDFMQRRSFVYDATDGMAVDAVLDIVQAAAESSHQSISHSLVRMLAKLAAHAETGTEQVRPQADAALRDQVRRLLEGWTLADPNPDAYGAALQGMSRAAPPTPPTPPAPPGSPAAHGPDRGGHPTEPDRIVAMALEVDTVSQHVLDAAAGVVAEGRLGRLLDALEQVPESQWAAAAVWARIATADVVRSLATHDPVDFATLERLVPRVGVPAAPPLLDALATAVARGTRRGLLAQLAKMGAGIAPLVIQRLDAPHWYVTRNLLALLEELSPLPQGFSAAAYLRHADARVRWQAVKLQVKLPQERDAALAAGLQDPDARTLRLALGLAVALQSCPDGAVPALTSHAVDRTLPTDLRVLAIRALGYARVSGALTTLLRLTSGGRSLFGREKWPPKSPELLVALTALAAGWQGDARARATLARAAAASDVEIRAAAQGGGLRA